MPKKMTFPATLVTAGKQNLEGDRPQRRRPSPAPESETSTVQAATTKSLAVTGFPTTATAGTAYNYTVTAYDGYGNVATGYTGTIKFTSSDPQAVLPANYTFTTGNAGTHTFSATLKTASVQSITATDTSTPSITGTESNITVKAAAAYVLAITGLPTNVKAGTAYSFAVTAYDAYGNVVTGYLDTLQFSSSDSAANLPANYTFTAADAGTYRFTITFGTKGTQTH